MWIYKLMGGRTLGHGRALESFLAFICAVYAAILLAYPEAQYQSQATAPLAWRGYGWVFPIPFIAKSFFTAIGVYGNINAWPHSRTYRVIGGFIGTFIWLWFLTQYIAFDMFGALGAALCIGGTVASVRIIGMAWANLPIPGSIDGNGKIGIREAKLLAAAQFALLMDGQSGKDALKEALKDYSA